MFLQILLVRFAFFVWFCDVFYFGCDVLMWVRFRNGVLPFFSGGPCFCWWGAVYLDPLRVQYLPQNPCEANPKKYPWKAACPLDLLVENA